MRIGELFLLGYDPGDFTHLLDNAKHYGLGGIILFDRNFVSLNKLADQLKALEDACGGKIIVAVDQEGGPVNRIRTDFPLFPSARSYGDRADFEGLKIMAGTTARHLRKLGINTNLAPVCDVLTNPDNILMQKRSYGTSPDLVSDCIEIIINEYHRHHILCCAKHFPGLGSAAIDPHQEISTTGIGLDEFEKKHWPPFMAAASCGVDFIMTTHLIAPALDPINMATFSKQIGETIIRDKTGFEGVLISDDLCMGAVTRHYTPHQAACMALEAGHDMVMFCHNFESQDLALKNSLDDYNNGRLGGELIEGKLARIKKLKDELK